MSEQNELAAGALGSISLDGKTWLIDQITDQMVATLHKHMRVAMKSPLAAIAESVKGLPPDLQKFAIAEAVKLQSEGGATGNSAWFQEQLMSADGCGFLFWLLARRNHPDLTHQEATKMVTAAGPEVMLTQLGEASGMKALGDSKGN